MSRIASDATRIEHWHSQHHYDEQLDYTNMLAACHGNEGRPCEDQHCDVSKRDLDLDFNPANPAHDVERRVNYDGFGRITSSDAPFSAQINDVLNLNYCRLRWNRRAVVHAVIAACGSKRGTRSKRQIERLISSWSGKDSSGCYKEYCGVAIHWLRKRLRRC
jgi:hypothetical protein